MSGSGRTLTALHGPKNSLPTSKASSLHSFWEVHPDHLPLTLLKSNRTGFRSAQIFFHHCFPFWSLLHPINGDANQKPKSRPGPWQIQPGRGLNREGANSAVRQQARWGSIHREWEGRGKGGTGDISYFWSRSTLSLIWNEKNLKTSGPLVQF